MFEITLRLELPPNVLVIKQQALVLGIRKIHSKYPGNRYPQAFSRLVVS